MKYDEIMMFCKWKSVQDFFLWLRLCEKNYRKIRKKWKLRKIKNS